MTANANNSAAAGFIVIANDRMAIYATGRTETEAQADYQEQTKEMWGTGSERTVPATAALLEAVERDGGAPGDVAWEIVHGLARVAE